MSEESDTWYPDFASCAMCHGYVFAPVVAGDPTAVELGVCPCVALADESLWSINEDEEDDDRVGKTNTLSLSEALGIDTDSRCRINTTTGKLNKRLSNVPQKQSRNTGLVQRNQRKHRNIMQPRPGF